LKTIDTILPGNSAIVFVSVCLWFSPFVDYFDGTRKVQFQGGDVESGFITIVSQEMKLMWYLMMAV
jgi:hypothetical protein